ncbi:MAG: phosphoribosylaminoimidazolesuccinocarboxamide synthase, partial [Luteibaculum sp.]
MKTISEEPLQLHPDQKLYQGKVRDVYSLPNDLLVMVASDRISAFDVILPKRIPFKGQVLNLTAMHFLKSTQDICPNWFISSPHPNISIGKRAEPFKVEMVIRGYLAGHAWREYKSGKRSVCGVGMPEGMRENQKFPEPIITPATKAEEGHDEDISREEILRQGIVSENHYHLLEKYTKALFKRGQEEAQKRGLILVDTKYEFGLSDGEVV